MKDFHANTNTSQIYINNGRHKLPTLVFEMINDMYIGNEFCIFSDNACLNYTILAQEKDGQEYLMM